MEPIISTKKKIIIIVIFAFVFLLIPIIAFTHSRINSASIDLLVAPESSNIHIDNHKVTNGKIGVTPGKHTVTARKDGFAEKSTEVEIKSGETSNVHFILESNDPSTANWYKDHPEDQKIAQQINDSQFDSEAASYTEENPIIKYLPFETANYSLNYGSCDVSDFCIFVDTPQIHYDKIVDIIKELTDDPARYYYVFKGYKNPFENLKTSTEEPETLSLSDLDSAKAFMDKTLEKYTHFLSGLSVVDNYVIGSFTYQINQYKDVNTYRFVIQKNKNGSWVFSSTPELIPTYIVNKNIPHDVIKKVNEIK